VIWIEHRLLPKPILYRIWGRKDELPGGPFQPDFGLRGICGCPSLLAFFTKGWILIQSNLTSSF
jgi:hypothetical protein